ncbi:MAG: ubiquitin-like domain-containing protein [Anaerolineae bacterium]
MSTPHRADPERAAVRTPSVGAAAGRPSSAAGRAAALRPWLVLAGTLALAAQFPAAQRRAVRAITLDVGGRTERVLTTAASVRLVLAERGVGAGPADLVRPGRGEAIVDGGRITVRRARTVTVVADGRTRSVPERTVPLRTLLTDAGIALGAFDAATLNGRSWPLDEALPRQRARRCWRPPPRPRRARRCSAARSARTSPSPTRSAPRRAIGRAASPSRRACARRRAGRSNRR